MRPITFRYGVFHGIPSPVIPVQLRGPRGWKEVWTYVDSGASVSILAEGEAHLLGLALTRGRLTYSTVGDGSAIPVYVHRLPVRIGAVQLSAHVGFSPKLGVGFNLLGRQDIFAHFDITFSDATRTVTFRPRVR